MKSWLRAAILVALIVPQSRTLPAQATPRNRPARTLSTSEIVSRVRNSLVVVSTLDSGGNPLAEGSGFFISPGRVVTNLHMLKRASQATVKSIADGVAHKVTEVSAFSLNHDLCILEVPDGKGVPLSTEMGTPSVGDEILVGGNPEGLEATFSKGMVSAIRSEQGLIQIDAPISHGSSGGPVVNQLGAVIAVTVSTLSEGQNLNFAIPIKFLQDGMLSGHSETVWAMGRLAVTDVENLGLHGSVKQFFESRSGYSLDSAGKTFTEDPVLRTAGTGFNREGRIQKMEFYKNGLGMCRG